MSIFLHGKDKKEIDFLKTSNPWELFHKLQIPCFFYHKHEEEIISQKMAQKLYFCRILTWATDKTDYFIRLPFTEGGCVSQKMSTNGTRILVLLSGGTTRKLGDQWSELKMECHRRLLAETCYLVTVQSCDIMLYVWGIILSIVLLIGLPSFFQMQSTIHAIFYILSCVSVFQLMILRLQLRVGIENLSTIEEYHQDRIFLHFQCHERCETS